MSDLSEWPNPNSSQLELAKGLQAAAEQFNHGFHGWTRMGKSSEQDAEDGGPMAVH
jgi:hypothetical protein